MDYKEILNQYKYESDKEIKQKASAVEPFDYERNRDLINEIVLWKLNRLVTVSDETIRQIHNLGKSVHRPSDTVDSREVEAVILGLLSSKGIKIAMASTILHFYYPAVFPIIDQRAYRELTGAEMPAYHSKDSNERYTELYLDYIKKCFDYNSKVVPDAEFACIDKILYQLDKNKHNKVKY